MKDVDNSKIAIRTEVVYVNKNDPNTVSVFLSLGRDYLKALPHEERERFLKSILVRQEEPDRWLLLLRYENKYVGFTHVKIDNEERIGWGFILEFYIVPTRRKMGLGRTFFNLVADMLQANGVKDVWLLADSSAESFWHSLGFKSTGELDRETGQKVMAKSLTYTTKTKYISFAMKTSQIVDYHSEFM
ncbi:MAG: Acetyltransferase (GNAT) family protein [Candidatus Bathyarchaeota archaeon BA1]|nr:MAG: Acetyltransferase (GNAT) family protein [Candidatus Bathyarchaeota archaeon BA1]